MARLHALTRDEAPEEVRSFHSAPDLVEPGAIVALVNFRSRFNRIFRVEANGMHCPPTAGAGHPSTARPR